MTMLPNTDIDIDFKNRDEALSVLEHVPASIIKNGKIKKHNNGVYFNQVPVDPLTGFCSIDYEKAEERGYTKIDFLNLSVYEKVKDEEHLMRLMEKEPVWELLENEDIVTGKLTGQPLFHLHDQFELLQKKKPRTIEQLAMVLALKIPSKHYLIDKDWDEIEKHIWKEPADGEFYFKKSHSISYAHVVVLQLNLLVEEFTENN